MYIELSTNRPGLAGGAITKPVFFTDPGGQDVDVDTDGGAEVSAHLYILSATGAAGTVGVPGEVSFLRIPDIDGASANLLQTRRVLASLPPRWCM